MNPQKVSNPFSFVQVKKTESLQTSELSPLYIYDKRLHQLEFNEQALEERLSYVEQKLKLLSINH